MPQAWIRQEMYINFWFGNLKGKDHQEERKMKFVEIMSDDYGLYLYDSGLGQTAACCEDGN
jgi:hypothetical protein